MNADQTSLIFGHNPDPGLVAVEHVEDSKADEMLLFIRQGSEVRQVREPFTPFFWIRDKSMLDGYSGPVEIESLEGRTALKTLVLFRTWQDLQTLVGWMKNRTGRDPSDPGSPFFLLSDPVQQHLMRTGRTLFKGMLFSDLRRLQVDIETYTAGGYEFPNAEREGDRIIAIAMADQSGWSEVLSGAVLDEKTMLQQFVERVREKDPDAIEGHNIFKFDLPYLTTRAKMHKVKFALGRDGSQPTVRPSRWSIADRTIVYPRAILYGRHVIDTLFLAQTYDISHRSLESFGLKDIAMHFGVAAKDRVYIDGGEISSVFDKEPERVMKYALDDIRETSAVSEILSQSFFVQAQILPFSYQNICVRGNGMKIDSLLLREYLRRGHSVPQPDTPRSFEGGYTDIFFTGIARNVHHCDVRSLYPSLLLNHRLGPRTDELGLFLKALDYLRDLRLETRKRMKSAAASERHFLDAMQSTFKILINSFFGYMGFAQARFGDYDMAERVTAEGRALLKQMIEWIKTNKGNPIEIDTDGVFFVPPPFINDAEKEKFQSAFQSFLPKGIEIEFDAEYRTMFSYKMKNYALLDDRGEITIRGAALKSRGLEPFQRDFIEDWLRLKLEERDKDIPKLVAKYRKGIQERKWPIRMLAKTVTLQDNPSTYANKLQQGDRGRSAPYKLALMSGREYRAGDVLSYYITGHHPKVPAHEGAKLVSEWNSDQRDENVAYYLAKLDALCEKFDAVAPDEHPELDFGF